MVIFTPTLSYNLYFCRRSAMQKKIKICPKHLLALLLGLLIFTKPSQSKEYVNGSGTICTFLTQYFNNQTASKNDLFFVEEKQKLTKDTIPLQSSSKDTIPAAPDRSKTAPADTLPRINDSLFIKEKIAVSDSLIGTDSLLLTDSSGVLKDTIPYQLAPNALEHIIDYSAEDSMIVNVPAKTVTLYGEKAQTNYIDNEITAPVISFDQATGDIYASLKRDSTGKPIAMPTYKQGEFVSQSDSFRFNMKSGKGLTKSTYTQQGEMYVYGEVIKKMADDVFYALRGRFTTCNLDTPHFAFISNKIKFITDKVAISGPVHPEFEGIPIPVYLPFGIYPLSQGRHSGLLAPNFTTNQQKGLGLEGLGYYKVISDNWDIIARTNIYSYGSWSLNLNPRYLKRYHYTGNFSLNIENTKINFKGDPDYVHQTGFNILWNHSADTKSRPGVSFSASVNAGTSNFNKLVADDPVRNFSNRLTSSIRYSKTWKGKPFNLQLSANHDQNTNTKLINIVLPTGSFSINTIYPFRKKEFVGETKWYENLGIGYSTSFQNRISFYDTAKYDNVIRHLLDTATWGIRHSVPISLSLPPISIFQISPSVSYDETWYQKKVTRRWDPTGDSLTLDVEKGLFTARQMSFGVGISTRIFGMIAAKNPKARINAIRHEMRPSFNLNYRPDMNKRNYYYVQTDTTGKRSLFPYYDGAYNVNGPYSTGTFGGFSFGLENNVSMKVRNPKDTGENALKKISILDQLSINSSYNLVADSFNLSPFSISASTSLFDKVNITGSGSIDPYQVNSEGRRIDRYVWKDHLSLGRLRNLNLSLSSQFQGGDKSKGTEPGLAPGRPINDPNQMYGDEYDNEMAYIRENPGEFADFNIPWSVNLSYSFTLNKSFIKGRGFENNLSQNVNFNGTLNITPKWQLGVTGYYNINLGQLNPLSMSISRDLHCWQMSVALSPIGYYRYFSITISPKSPLLRDLKINRKRSQRTGF